MVHVAAVLLEREVVDPLALLRGAEREQRHDLRLAAGEERRAVRARADRHLDLDRADLRLGAAVRTPLVDRDLLADEVLVDRLARLADVRFVSESLRARPRRRPPGNGSSTVRRSARRAGAASPTSAPSSPARPRSAPEVGLELLAHRALDGGRALLLEDHPERHPASGARAGCRPRSSSWSARRHSSRSPRRSRRPRGGLLRIGPDLVAVRSLEPVGHLRVEPLRLAGLARSSSWASQSLSISRARARAPRGASPREPDRAGLDHRQASLVPTTIRSSSHSRSSAASG